MNGWPAGCFDGASCWSHLKACARCRRPETSGRSQCCYLNVSFKSFAGCNLFAFEERSYGCSFEMERSAEVLVGNGAFLESLGCCCSWKYVSRSEMGSAILILDKEAQVKALDWSSNADSWCLKGLPIWTSAPFIPYLYVHLFDFDQSLQSSALVQHLDS